MTKTVQISKHGIPLDGGTAMLSGWPVTANPFAPAKRRSDPEGSCRFMEWIAEWHTANAAAYRDHVFGGKEKNDVKNK